MFDVNEWWKTVEKNRIATFLSDFCSFDRLRGSFLDFALFDFVRLFVRSSSRVRFGLFVFDTGQANLFNF